MPLSGRTCTELAAATAVRAGEPEGVYPDGGGADPEQVLTLDARAAWWLERCWAAGAQALTRLAPNEEPILWPGHFDVGIQSGGVGYGVSPVTATSPSPTRAYVSPLSARTGEFWNQPFGAARTMRELGDGSADAVLEFFVDGRRHAA